MKKLLLGSGNSAKVRELRELLTGLPLEVLALSDLAPRPAEAPETGVTFMANAAQKALHYAALTGLPVLADDSGLCVDSLQGAPGVWSARWSGPSATDASNNAKLLRELQAFPAAQRGAAYHAALVLALPGPPQDRTAGRVLLAVEERCSGVILETPRGAGGFGYDPLFFIPDLGKTFAELPSPQKHEISHRGKALRALLARLPSVLHELEMS